jgi:eukaryotic-like serine/threonine-protein kinase
MADDVIDTARFGDQLRLDRPVFAGALDGLRERVLVGLASRGPRMIGRYRLGRAIGSGAFGTVHEAEDPQLARKVAIKLFGTGPNHETERVLREARMLATVNAPNVVHVFEVGTLDDATGTAYLVMELVEGPTLREYLGARTRPWREVVQLMLAAARGLWAAHRQGVVHRDFKPDNVILASDGRPRVVDFGLARAAGEDDLDTAPISGGPLDCTLTPTGAVMGTPAYMAPECFSGPCTVLSDQYSLCVALYEGLFGTRPFAARSTEELRERLARENPRAPRDRRGVPAPVIRAVMRGLRRIPSERHRGLGQFIACLERAAGPRRLGSLGLGATGLAVALASLGMGASDEPCLTSAAALQRLASHGDFAASQSDYLAR